MSEYDHTVIGVFDPDGEDPSFVYSVGLRAKGWPELLLIGLDPRDGCVFLNMLSELSKPPIGLVDIGGEHPTFARPVDPDEAHENWTCQAAWGPVIQIIVPDTAGRFPWDPGCEEPYASVPLLSEGAS